eukprot:4786682-Pleurochrysis_carterae.AAC.1
MEIVSGQVGASALFLPLKMRVAAFSSPATAHACEVDCEMISRARSHAGDSDVGVLSTQTDVILAFTSNSRPHPSRAQPHEAAPLHTLTASQNI